MKKFAILAAGLMLAASTGMAERVLFLAHTGEVIPASELPKPTEEQLKNSTVKKGAPVSYTITYLDGAGQGFNDGVQGAARKATLEAVLDYIFGSVIQNTGTLTVTVNASLNSGSGPLATAGTLYDVVAGGSFQPGDAFGSITTGVDAFPGDPDISVTVDFGYIWNSDHTQSPLPAQFDLFSVLLHEITHGLGVAAATNASGASQLGDDNFTTWEELIYRTSNNTRVWAPPQPYYSGAPLNGGNNTLDFRGTNAVATFGGNPPIYSPASFAGGSSISHWQLGIPGGAVMFPAIANGTEQRTYAPWEIGALQDLGYIVTAVGDWDMY